MIRNAASVLLRRSTASAASLSRATPGQIVAPHPLRPQSPGLSAARGFHAAAKSGQRRADTTMMLPARRHGHSSAKNTMENTSSAEEKAAALWQVLFEEEAATAAFKRNKQRLKELEETSRLMARSAVLEKEMKATKAARKAKTEELLAVIDRQSGSGVDQKTLVLAWLAQAKQDIEVLKLNMIYLCVYLVLVHGGALGYICLSK